MQLSRRRFVSAMALSMLPIASLSAAPPKTTAVYVKNMHCPTCAKKIASKLYTVPGVVKVSTNVKKGVAIIVPQSGKNPSPKAVWEAVEAATFQPIRVASPLGTFTKRPKF